jgi:AcrR family transcriptional regulator
MSIDFSNRDFGKGRATGVEAEADAASEPARAAVRCGRPPRGLAGQVEERILDAAGHVFLERGFRAASVEEIAEVACAGKPTIYARYGSKEALFAAVVARMVRANTTIECVAAMGSSIEQRLEAMASVILARILSPESIGLMRAVVAEARRFPDLAISVKHQARDVGIESVARLLGEVARSGELSAFPAFAPEQLSETARRFMDVIVFPMAMRALFGEDLTRLRAEIGPHVKQAVAFFLAACRQGAPASGGKDQLAMSEGAVL